jgi:hypothetical protein
MLAVTSCAHNRNEEAFITIARSTSDTTIKDFPIFITDLQGRSLKFLLQLVHTCYIALSFPASREKCRFCQKTFELAHLLLVGLFRIEQSIKEILAGGLFSTASSLIESNIRRLDWEGSGSRKRLRICLEKGPTAIKR